MENLENLENIENVENLEALLANGGEPEDTEEAIARREEALKEAAEYYKLISSGKYYVRMLDPDKGVTAEPLTVNPEDEALLKTYFQLKAMQNSGNISPLNWNSSGNKGNLYADADEWDRIGVSCCADGTSDTPGFVYSFSEHILDSSDTHGNKNFKAVMVKADYQVIVPAYSEVTLNVTMNIHVFKRGGRHLPHGWARVSLKKIHGRRSMMIMIKTTSGRITMESSKQITLRTAPLPPVTAKR